MNDCEIEWRVTIKAHSWTINQQNFLAWHKKNCERRLVRVGTTIVGGTQATERRVKNTAGERNGRKTKHCWGLGVAIKKWSRHDDFLRRPKAGRLHPSSKSGPDIIISCGDLRLVGSTRHRKVSQNPGLVGGVVFQRLHQNPHYIW